MATPVLARSTTGAHRVMGHTSLSTRNFNSDYQTLEYAYNTLFSRTSCLEFITLSDDGLLLNSNTILNACQTMITFFGVEPQYIQVQSHPIKLNQVGGIDDGKLLSVILKSVMHIAIDVAADVGEGVAGFKGLFGQRLSSERRNLETTTHNVNSLIQIRLMAIKQFIYASSIHSKGNVVPHHTLFSHVNGVVIGIVQGQEDNLKQYLQSYYGVTGTFDPEKWLFYFRIFMGIGGTKYEQYTIHKILHPTHTKEKRKNIIVSLLNKVRGKLVHTEINVANLAEQMSKVSMVAATPSTMSPAASIGTPLSPSSSVSSSSSLDILSQISTGQVYIELEETTPQAAGSRTPYTKRNVKDLRTLAKARGIKGYSTMNKNTLVSELRQRRKKSS